MKPKPWGRILVCPGTNGWDINITDPHLTPIATGRIPLTAELLSSAGPTICCPLYPVPRPPARPGPFRRAAAACRLFWLGLCLGFHSW